MSNQQQDWSEMFEQMNDAFTDSVEKSMQAQSELMESMSGSMETSMPDEDTMADGIEGYAAAYEVWMNATEEILERTADAAQGEEVEPEEFRDIWLRSANEAFSEVLSTSAFAQANGQLVEQMMEMQQEVNDVTQDSLAQMGMATGDDVEEVAERLIELERRQHEVENKLDQLIDAVESN